MALRRRLVQPSATPFSPRTVSRPPLPLAELSAAFRQRGLDVAEISPEAARTFEFCAAWLDASLEARMDEALTLAEASAESGWSYEGLRQKLSKERLLNAAESGAPMILRRHLPLLGAARGPRGKYQRKPKSRAAEVTPATEGDVSGVSHGDATVTRVAAQVSSPTVPMAALQPHRDELATAAPDSEASAPHLLESGSPSLAPEHDLERAATNPDVRSPRAMPGPRKASTRKRQSSARARFEELRALAALS